MLSFSRNPQRSKEVGEGHGELACGVGQREAWQTLQLSTYKTTQNVRNWRLASARTRLGGACNLQRFNPGCEWAPGM